MGTSNIDKLRSKALELFEGDQERADIWLERKLRALGNRSPLECAESPEGLEEVLNLIIRLEYGVIS